VQTNIVVFTLAPQAPDAPALVAAARAAGVWVNALGPRTIRALTHRDVTREQCLRAADVLRHAADA
jgi:threonine aldolase